MYDRLCEDEYSAPVKKVQPANIRTFAPDRSKHIRRFDSVVDTTI